MLTAEHSQRLDAAAFLRLLKAAYQSLERQRASIDALNVFPVPDGDTGTNMSLTMAACVREVQGLGAGAPLRQLAEVAARSSLMGARGNSGVILSQFFRGFARFVVGHARYGEALDGAGLAQAMTAAAETAYQAVIKPVEGTMLTVGRAAARAAERASRRVGAGVEEVLAAALQGAQYALERTPTQLAILARAGVVDAGGMGIVALLQGALDSLGAGTHTAAAAQTATAARPADPSASAVSPAEAPVALPGHDAAGGITESDISYGYCTEFLLRGQRLPADRIRRELEGHGDSLLVVGDDHLLKIHVHTNHPGRTLDFCQQWGELLNISIGNMREQNRRAAQERRQKPSGEPIRTKEATSAGTPSPAMRGPGIARGALQATTTTPASDAAAAGARRAATRVEPPAGSGDPVGPGRGTPARNGSQRTTTSARVPNAPTPPPPQGAASLVAVVSGPGLEAIFRSLGVEATVSGGQTMNPSTEELVAAVEQVRAPTAILLPNNGNVMMAAQQVQQLTRKAVRVIPCRTVPQGLAAALAYRPDGDVPENVRRMEAAAQRVGTGEVTYAVRQSRLEEHQIEPGDIMGLAEGELVEVGKDRVEVTARLARRLLNANHGRSLLTLYYGQDVSAEEAERLVRRLRAELDGTEVEVYYGGQPVYFYLLAVE